MITIKNAKNVLENRIGEETTDVKMVWELFKEFCKEPVEGEEERQILFQCGVYDFTGEDLFHFSFLRQFTVYEDEEESDEDEDEDEDFDGYSHMEQLECLFLFTPTEKLKQLEETEWSMDYESLGEYFETVENLEAFQITLKLNPVKFELYQEEI